MYLPYRLDIVVGGVRACGEEVRHVSTSCNWQRLQRGEGDLVGQLVCFL